MTDAFLDIGNTRIKTALETENEVMGAVKTFTSLSQVENFLRSSAIDRVWFSDVTKLSYGWEPFGVETVPLKFRPDMPVDLGHYPAQQLGNDRLAALLGAEALFPEKERLIIDAGTALTLERLDSTGRFLGGNISPGLTMRYKAMHQLTEALPLVERPEQELTWGQNTEQAMQNGGLLGWKYEVKGVIDYFCTHSPNGVVILTGGDAPLLEEVVGEKNGHFVPHLVLEGLRLAAKS